MKSRFLKAVRTVLAPVALVVAMAAFSPVSALAAVRGGGIRTDLSFRADASFLLSPQT